jgi:hypothetical protein
MTLSYMDSCFKTGIVYLNYSFFYLYRYGSREVQGCPYYDAVTLISAIGGAIMVNILMAGTAIFRPVEVFACVWIVDG